MTHKIVRISGTSKGAFLLEALIATVILAVGLTGIIRTFSIGIDGYKRSREYFTATILLENKLTELLCRRYFDDTMIGSGEFDEPFTGYRYEIFAEDVIDSDFLKEVKVAVFWKGRNGEISVDAITELFLSPQEKG